MLMRSLGCHESKYRSRLIVPGMVGGRCMFHPGQKSALNERKRVQLATRGDEAKGQRRANIDLLRVFAMFGALAAYIALYLLYEFYWRYSNAVLYAPNECSYITVMEPLACCLVYAVLCFLLFSGFQMRNGRLAKVLESISSSTIGIYIFHLYVIDFPSSSRIRPGGMTGPREASLCSCCLTACS